MEVTGTPYKGGKTGMEEKVFKVAFLLINNDDENETFDNSEQDLQSAFCTFKKKRIEQLRRNKSSESIPRTITCDEKIELRNKFLSKLFSYIGTPYAKHFHKPGCTYFDRKLYLDCCGLIRRVLKDLSSDFGFVIGPWNQAYLYDTLPIKFAATEQMKPGDLVFISATYFDQKKKKQKHDMVHVEVWLGQEAKTIGSRWYKGTVQVFDSYKFISKSYYSMKYHFCSIETWLDGICRSFCPEHKWLRHKYSPKKHSIFRYEDDDDDDDEDEDDDDDDDETSQQKKD